MPRDESGDFKVFLRFYTLIRYSLPRLFHMWKPGAGPVPVLAPLVLTAAMFPP
jgi:hypothetical protein